MKTQQLNTQIAQKQVSHTSLRYNSSTLESCLSLKEANKTIKLIKEGSSFFAIVEEAGKRSYEIPVNLPNHFKTIPADILTSALSKHGKSLIRKDGEIVGLKLFSILLGGGQVSSKVLSQQERAKKRTYEIDSKGNVDNEKRVFELRQQISDINLVLDEWKRKYKDLQREEERKVVEKIVEVPIEVVKFVEKPVVVERNADDRINELENQINEYEKRIGNWKNRFYSLEEQIHSEQSFYENNESTRIDMSLYSQPIDAKEIEVDDERDNTKLKLIREKMKSLKELSMELQKKCISLEARTKEKLIQVNVPINSYVDRPIETVIYDNSIIDALNEKILRLNDNLSEWKTKYAEYEAENSDSKIEHKRVETKTVLENPGDCEYLLEEEDESVNRLKEDLDHLRETLFEWNNRCSEIQNEIVEKIVEVPIEVIKYVERPVERIINDDSKVKELQNHIGEIYAEVENWKTKFSAYNKHVTQVSRPRPTGAKVENTVENVEDQRVQEMKNKIEDLKKNIKEWEYTYKELQEKEQTIIEKTVEVQVPVTKYIPRPVEKVVNDDEKVTELRAKIEAMTLKLNEARAKNVKRDKLAPLFVEKIVEVPVEVIKTVERKIEKIVIDEERIKQLTEELNRLQLELSEWEKKCQELEHKEVQIVEKVIEVPVERIKYIDKIVEVPTADEERLRRVTADYEVLQKTLAMWQQKYNDLNKPEVTYVETYVEQPVDVIQYIDIPVEVLKVDQEKLRVLTEKHRLLIAELDEIKTNIAIKKRKEVRYVERFVEVPVERIEYIETEVDVWQVDQKKIDELTKECDLLTETLHHWQDKYESLYAQEIHIEEVIQEVPIEVYEYVDKPVEVRKPDDAKVRALQDEYFRLQKEIDEVKTRTTTLERTRTEKVQKIIEVPVEKIQYVDKVVEVIKRDEEKIRQLTKEYTELTVTLNNWRQKLEIVENKQDKIIEKIIEQPVEVIEYVDNQILVEKIDEKRIRELTREYEKLTHQIESIKEQCLALQKRKPKIVDKYVDIPIEVVQYVDNKVDIWKVDEEKLRLLNEEIKGLTEKLETLTFKYQEMDKSTVRVVEKIVEVPREIIEHVEYNVDVTKVDEARIQEINDEIQQLNEQIHEWMEKYNQIQNEEVKVVTSIIETPVEIVEYVDNPVECVVVNEDSVNALKNEYAVLQRELESLQEEIRKIERSDAYIVEKYVKKPVPVTKVIEREVEVPTVDESKLKRLERELQKVTDRIHDCSEMIHELQTAETRIVEKYVEVPVEKIVYVDKEVNVVKVDKERIDILRDRIRQLEKDIRAVRPPSIKKNVARTQIIEKFVDEPYERIQTIETKVEVVKIDEEKFKEVVGQYNAMVEELASWRSKLIELENQQADIIEKVVQVPIERIEYIDKVIEIVKVDQSKIDELNKEILSATEALEMWRTKVMEIETVKKRVIEKYVDVPREVVEVVDRVVEVIKEDEKRIKELTEEYDDYCDQLTKLKYEVSLFAKTEPVVVERIVEIPEEKIEYIDKIVEVVTVDQERLKQLNDEYNGIIEQIVNQQNVIIEEEEVVPKVVEVIREIPVERIEYIDVIQEVVKIDEEKIRYLEEQINKYTNKAEGYKKRIQKYVKLPPTIVEKKVEVPVEVVQFVDNEVEVVKVDEERVRELSDAVGKLRDTVDSLQRQYDEIERSKVQIVKTIQEVPVEVVKYIDIPVEVVRYNDSKIKYLEQGIEGMRHTLKDWLSKYEEIPEDDESKIHIKARIPPAPKVRNYDMPNVEDDDDERLNKITDEISQLNDVLIGIADEFKKIETKDVQIVEKIVKVPVEVVKYVDRPYEVVKVDDGRVRELEREIGLLQSNIAEYSNIQANPENTKEYIQTVHAIDTTEHIKRPKEVYRDDSNVALLEEQIEKINSHVKQWRNKYKELSKRERKVIERIVEVPVEVIKYIDNKRETIKKDDQRIQLLEKELAQLSTQFGEWQYMFTSEEETTVTSARRRSPNQVIEQLPTQIKQNPEYLEIQDKISRFAQEFNNLRRCYEELDRMEKVIVAKVVEIPKECVEYIETTIETEDIRPKQYLRELEEVSSTLNAWQKGILSKKAITDGQVVEKKLNVVENYVDNTPQLVRDLTAEKELEQELEEISKLVYEYEAGIQNVEVEKQEVITKVTQVKKEIEKIVEKDIEVLVKDVSHEEALEEFIRNARNAVNEKRNEYNTKQRADVEIIEKIVKVQKEYIKYINRNIEIAKNDDKEVKYMEQRYADLQRDLDRLIQRCYDLENQEVEVVEKQIKIPKEVIKTLERKVYVEKFDEKPVLEMIEKLNTLNVTLHDARAELIDIPDDDVEIRDKIIEVKKEVVKYETRVVEVVKIDDTRVQDLIKRKEQLKDRINVWRDKYEVQSKLGRQVITKRIEIPVLIVKTAYRTMGEVRYEESPIHEWVDKVNALTATLTGKSIELNNIEREKVNIIEEIIEVPKEIIKTVENVIEKIIWDDSEIRELEIRIRESRKAIQQTEIRYTTVEAQKEKVTEKVTRVKKEVKKYIVRDNEKVVFNEEPVSELEEDIKQLKVNLNEWVDKLNDLKAQKLPIIENVIEVEKEKLVKVKRNLENIRYDERPIVEAVEKITHLQSSIRSINDKLSKNEGRKYKTVEKIVEVPKDVIVYKPKKKESTIWDETAIEELTILRGRVEAKLNEWKEKVNNLRRDKNKVIRRTIEVPKKVVKKVNRDLEVTVYDDTEARHWEDKCKALRVQIEAQTKRKLEASKECTEIIEKIIEVPYEVITYEDKRIEVPVLDERPIRELEAKLLKYNEELNIIENRRREVERDARQPIEKIVEVIKEVIKRVERKKENIIWDDAEIHELEERIKELVEERNRIACEPVEEDDAEIQIVEKIVKVPREIIKYVEKVKEVPVYDDSPIDEVLMQMKELRPQLDEVKNKVAALKRNSRRVIEVVKYEEVQRVKYVENVIEQVRYDDRPVRALQQKLEQIRRREEEFKNTYKIKKTQREELVEKVIEVKRDVIKKVEKVREITKWDDRRIKELEGKINDIKNHIYEQRTIIKKAGKRENTIIEKIIKVKKEIKIYQERLVEKVVYDNTLIKEWENKIRNARNKLKNVPVIKNPVKKIKEQIIEKVVEVKKEVVKRIERPHIVVRYDDTLIRDLERKVAIAKKTYVPPQREIHEIIEEEGDIIEKIVEVPKKYVTYIDRTIERIRYDDSQIKQLEKELDTLEDLQDTLTRRIEAALAKKNLVREEIEQVRVEVIRWVPRQVEVVKIKDGNVGVLEEELERLNTYLKQIIEQYNNIKKADKQYIVKTVEVPYETIRYVDKEVEVLRVDDKKVAALERKLAQLKDKENQMRDELEQVNQQKKTVIEKVVEVPKEVIKFVDRPVKTWKLEEERLRELEDNLRNATNELNVWKKKCDDYDIVKEKIIEVPVEVIKEVSYPVEVIKVEDKLVLELAQHVSDIKSALHELECKHDFLLEEQNKTVEKIIEVPKKFIKYVERDIEVFKVDKEKVNELNVEVQRLKRGIASGKKDFREFEKKKKIIEKRVEKEEEVIKYIEKPIDVITMSKNAMKEIESQFNKAYSLLEQWKEKYEELKKQKFAAEEKIVEVEVEKKLFGIKRIDILKPNENDILKLQSEIDRLNAGISEFKNTCSTVRNSLRTNIVNERRIEVPVERIVYVDVPTEIVTIDDRAKRDIKDELRRLRQSVQVFGKN
jgi:DNA repair exonuclease SbcCD ATPase subunit